MSDGIISQECFRNGRRLEILMPIDLALLSADHLARATDKSGRRQQQRDL